MNEYIGELTLDLDCRKAMPKIAVGQFDKGRKYLVHITANGISYSAEGCSIVIQGVRSNKSHFSAPCSVDNNGSVILVLSEDMLSSGGYAYAKLILSDENKNYSTQVFAIDIDSSFEGDITSDENYSIVNYFMNELMMLFSLNDPDEMLKQYPTIQNIQLNGNSDYPNVDTAVENNVIYRLFSSGSGTPLGWLLFGGSKYYANVTVSQIQFNRLGELKYRTGITGSQSSGTAGTVSWSNAWKSIATMDDINERLGDIESLLTEV